MDSIDPHMIDIEPASARNTVTTTNTKFHKKPKARPKKGSDLRGFGKVKQQQSAIKPKPQGTKFKQARHKTWKPLKIKCKKLRKMYETEEGRYNYPEGVVDNFFEKMQMLEMANNEQDLYNFRNLGFHKLDGNRQGQYAVWLTGNWRLTIAIKEDTESKYLLILDILDYH